MGVRLERVLCAQQLELGYGARNGRLGRVDVELKLEGNRLTSEE